MFLVHNIIRPKMKGINATENSRGEVFFKKGFMKTFEKLTGKHLCQSFFFNKVAGLGIFKNTFSCRTPLWLFLMLAIMNINFHCFIIF